MSLHWRLRRVLQVFDLNRERERVIRFWHRAVVARRIRSRDYAKFSGINLGCGSSKFPGYWNIDVNIGADFVLDLSRSNLPFPDNSMERVVCMSAINYFKRPRGAALIREVYRVLAPGGRARFGVQDLRIIARKYLEGDRAFFFQKEPDGRDRFEGVTMCDKVNAWFYGYETPGGPGKYVYDYETLALLFQQAGFSGIKEMKCGDSGIDGAGSLDNRSDQMFYLEAVK